MTKTAEAEVATLTIGDRDNEELAEIVDTRAEGDDLFISVRELIGGFSSWAGGQDAAMKVMEALARQASIYPDGQLSTKRVWTSLGCAYATFHSTP